MKQGWEIKKLGEVCEKIFAGGDKPKRFSDTPSEDMNVPVYANGVAKEGLCGYTDKSVVQQDCVTVSARGTIGFCCVRTTPFVPIVRLITIIPSDCIAIRYLYYVINNANIENNGVSIPQLTVPMIKQISIPVPPLPEQEKIVAELDCLSGIIEKKRQQLKELDALAQSIFYEMFGDPVENEKGWEVKKLGEVAIFKNGLNFKKVETGRKQLFLGVSDFKDKSLISKVDEYSSILIDEEFAEEFLLKDGDIVFVRSNGSKELVGRNVLIYTGNEK